MTGFKNFGSIHSMAIRVLKSKIEAGVAPYPVPHIPVNMFGTIIRSRRKNMKLSASELARMLDLEPSFVLTIEKGFIVRDRVDDGMICKIARVMDLNRMDLYLSLGRVPEDVISYLYHDRSVSIGICRCAELFALKEMRTLGNEILSSGFGKKILGGLMSPMSFLSRIISSNGKSVECPVDLGGVFSEDITFMGNPKGEA